MIEEKGKRTRMKMRKNVIIFIVFIFILLSVRSSLGAIDVDKCKDCHGKIAPIPSSKITKDCLVCHHTHAMPNNCCQPKTRVPEEVHNIHLDAGRLVSKTYGDCSRRCHQSPVVCTTCHNSHDNVNLSVNDTNASVCTNCHGQLPQPKGHEDFRGSLSENKHKWMTCNTCHLNLFGENYKFELHFKDLFVTSIDNSIGLCKICHSSQYEKLKVGIHGKPDDKCISCHNPHTTQLGGPKFQKTATPKEAPTNISEKVESASKWITTKVPILNNSFALFIIIIVIIAVIAEYLLSIHEEGTKVAYNMIKVQEKEDTLKTLEIKLKSGNIDYINSILIDQGINILGMTMSKEKAKEDGKDGEDGEEKDVYKYVLFINTVDKIIDEKGEKDIIDIITSISDVNSAEFTDKYEL